MSDKITQSSELKLKGKFYDGDDRTLTLDNPKSNLTSTQIKEAANTIKTTKAIIGDKGSADFVGFTEAKIVTRKTTVLDLN